MKRIWRLWCKTMGEKISTEKHESDFAAIIEHSGGCCILQPVVL